MNKEVTDLLLSVETFCRFCEKSLMAGPLTKYPSKEAKMILAMRSAAAELRKAEEPKA